MSRFEKGFGAPSLALVVSNDPVERNEEILNRYDVDFETHRRLKIAGKRAAHRLMCMMENDAQFEKLRPREQLKLMEIALSRAYGNVETQSADLKTAPLRQPEQVKHITSLRSLAAKADLPELRAAAKAKPRDAG